MNNFTEINSKRLTIRKFTLKDAETMFNNWASDNEVVRFLSWPVHQNVEVTKMVLNSWIKGYAENEYNWSLAISLKDSGEVVGSISTYNYTPKAAGSIEIGYCLSRKCWGNGYMPEAVNALTEFLMKEQNINRVEIRCDSENIPSAKVAEKCGYTYEGTLRQAGSNNTNKICDTKVYSKLRSEL